MKLILPAVGALALLAACNQTQYVRIADPACVAAQAGYVVNDDLYMDPKLGVAPLRCPMIWVPVEQIMAADGSAPPADDGGSTPRPPRPPKPETPTPAIVAESVRAGGGVAEADSVTVYQGTPKRPRFNATAGNVMVTDTKACTARLGCIE